MSLTTYSDLLRISAVRRILVLGLLIRVPLFGSFVVLTLHVVSHLEMSYGMAGVLAMFESLAIAVSGPWRGRLLDRIGLRRTLGPALLIYATCWVVAPWSGYWVLLGLVVVSGLFCPPVFTIVRQVMLAAVSTPRRTAALSLDSVFVELSFMTGPLLGVWLATQLPTPVALLVFQMLTVLGGALMWLDDPALVSAADEVPVTGSTGRRWITPWVVAVLVTGATATVVLNGADLGTVAALRSMQATGSIGWVLGLWGLSSALGGLIYGALAKPPPSYVLIALLAATTVPIALADGRMVFAFLLFLSGFFCAPTITATVADLARSVPASRRGEAMGWHGSAMTMGGAIGAPVAGFAIDQAGWQAAFVVVGTIGVAVAAIGMVVRRIRRSGVDAEGREDLAGRLAPVERVEVQTGSATAE